MEEKPSDKPSVSDAEWAAFVEAAREQGLGTEAQERALRRARVPKRPKPPKPPKPPKAPKRQEPAGWRTGPAWQEMNGRAARGRRVKAVLGVTLAAALALVAVRPQAVTGVLPESLASALPSSWTDLPEDTTPLAAETVPPTAAPEYADPGRPTLKEPFRGSPALRWADGAAGIEPPAAKATGWMSKSQVEAALKRSKDFLVAANLDPEVLRGGRPERALGLLDPKQPDLVSGMEKALAKPSERDDPTLLFSRFSPAEVRPVGTVVKVRGRMSVENGTGEHAGEVLIHTDYTFVYPVAKAGPGAGAVTRTVVRRQITFSLADPARFQATRGKLGVNAWDANVGNDACDRPEDGYFHPTFAEDRIADPSGPAVDPYDRSKDLDQLPKECGTVTRV
ncbi:hypothetical protein ABZ135_02285 [Streptomyces sp. NPDC006339]|uniref:hypothetical protein n=1 Tax=Streptomyces sp. NPDC006339 TaxID=3156755 RepID=UPI0033AD10EE